jgi:uncharacterized membrane protein YdjX (TVP38/TMEM64 family)
VLTPALFPGTVLAGAGGLLLVSTGRIAISLAGTVAGSLAAFAMARVAGGRAGDRLGGRRVQQLRARLECRGFLGVLVLRAASGVPATLLNYAAGLARVRAAVPLAMLLRRQRANRRAAAAARAG